MIARALQGIGAALLVPGSLAIISASFPERERGAGDRHVVRLHGNRDAMEGFRRARAVLVGGFIVIEDEEERHAVTDG